MAMISLLDFFLYDNRTWSPRWGRDWGLKAATGALADRADLKIEFDRYCGAILGEQSQLCGFGEAIGGTRSRNGYLLCVTLESSDYFSRPSWAVCGLWCPDSATLEQILSAGDPVGSARALLGVETPPSAIEIRPAKAAVDPRRRKHTSTDPTFRRFEPRSTVSEVASLLLGAAQDRTRLPNVLGITATSRLAAVAQAGFDLVYCHTMGSDRTERALARVLSSQKSKVEEQWLPPVEPSMPPAQRHFDPSSSAHLESRSFIFPVWILWLIGIAGVAVVFLLVGEIRRDAPINSRESSLPVKDDVLVSGDTPVSDTLVSKEGSHEAALKEIGERLGECKRLVPEDLYESPSFVAAETIEVLPEHQERRNRVRKAYSALIEIRNRVVNRQPGNYVAYYYDDKMGKDIAPAAKLQKIAEILGEAPLGSEDCAVLKKAFGFEFENRSSVIRQWCDSLGRLEETAVRSLSARRNR